MDDFKSDTETLRIAEIRHRMSNAFQLLQAVTRQQLSKSEGQEAQERLGVVLRQIETVAAQQSALSEADTGNLAGFVEKIEPLWQQIGEQAGATVRVHLDAAVPFSPRASETASRILLEAVTNCVEHAFPDGRRGTIDVAVDATDAHHCQFRVADNGVGMAHERQGQGTSIIRSLASELGGVAKWSDGDGDGTVMTVDFPVNMPDEVETMKQTNV